VNCVCDWLRDATGLDFGDRSCICNAAPVIRGKILQCWNGNSRWPGFNLRCYHCDGTWWNRVRSRHQRYNNNNTA